MRIQFIPFMASFALAVCCAAQDLPVKGLKVRVIEEPTGARLHFENLSGKTVTAWNVVVMNTRQPSGRPFNRTVHAEDCAFNPATAPIPPLSDWTSPLYPRPTRETVSQSVTIGAVIYADGTVEGEAAWKTALVSRRSVGRMVILLMLQALSDPKAADWAPARIQEAMEELKSTPLLEGNILAEQALNAYTRELVRPATNVIPGDNALPQRINSLRAQLARLESYKP